MEKTIKESIEFQAELSEEGYKISYSQTAENELGALMIAREILKYNKERLKNSVKQAQGKHLSLVQDRLQKISTTEYTLSMLIESILSQFLLPDEGVKEEVYEKIGSQ